MEGLTRIVIPLTKIRAEKFCLRESKDESALTGSLREFGLLQPLTVVANGKAFDCVSGHKRLVALKKLKKKTVPVDVLSITEPNKLFLAALLLNHAASYSDLDRARAVGKAKSDFLFSDLEIQNVVLPLLGLASSPKVLSQYQQVSTLPENVRNMIQLNLLPFQGSFWISKFKKADCDFLVRQLFPKIRPTASQLSHICEWLLDLIYTEKSTVSEVLSRGKLLTILRSKDIRAQTDLFYQALRSVRFPDLADKEKAFSLAAKEMKGQVQGLEIRAPDHFEQEGFFIRAHIQNPKSLAVVAQRLQDVQAQASTLFDTLL